MKTKKTTKKTNAKKVQAAPEKVVTYVWWVLGISIEDVYYRYTKRGPFASSPFAWLFNSQEQAAAICQQGSDPEGVKIPKDYKPIRFILQVRIDNADARLPQGFAWMRGKGYNQWEGKGKPFPGR